jgi:hypothetical protein
MDQTQTLPKAQQSFCSRMHIEKKEDYICYIYFGDARKAQEQTELSSWENNGGDDDNTKRANLAFNLLYLWLLGIQKLSAKQQLSFSDDQQEIVVK